MTENTKKRRKIKPKCEPIFSVTLTEEEKSHYECITTAPLGLYYVSGHSSHQFV